MLYAKQGHKQEKDLSSSSQQLRALIAANSVLRFNASDKSFPNIVRGGYSKVQWSVSNRRADRARVPIFSVCEGRSHALQLPGLRRNTRKHNKQTVRKRKR